jgi:cell division topological specificity factor
MGFLDYFKRQPKTAAIAKDRLQIIVARERTVTRDVADYLPKLQQELLQVIAKYELIDLGNVTVNVDKSGGVEVLELNIVLNDQKPKKEEPLPKLAAPATT